MTSAGSDAGYRLDAVRRDIAAACRDAGRDPASVTLVAVSKTFGADVVRPVIAAGQRVFGENRVQEAQAKWPALLAEYGAAGGLPPPASRSPPDQVGGGLSPLQGEVKGGGLELHLIGPLQSNKARDAVALFDAIHSVDRPSLCAALAKEIARQGRSPLLFVEINTGAEPQKAGILPEDADAFLTACRETHGLTIRGLMCIPPLDEAPAPHFALTAKIARRNGLDFLSMGMSADFQTAITFGATHVRVGTANFGHRA